MFDFQDLRVYALAKQQNKAIFNLLKIPAINPYFKHQLGRASISIAINIAEGSGRFSAADRRHFYVIARGSVYECVAILELMLDSKEVSKTDYETLIKEYTNISKMLFGMIESTR